MTGARRSACLFLILLASVLPLIAQKQSSIWYFGRNAGLDFRGGHPVPLNNGRLNTQEGVATYSDSDGNLVLYSDGKSVWNAEHTKVEYPDLTGDEFSTHSISIVPDNSNPNRLFLFTTKQFNANDPDNYGGNYYTVDITNPANPQVIANNAENGSEGLIKNSTEKFICIPHTYFDNVTGTQKPGYWIVMHEFGNAKFQIIKVDSIINPAKMIQYGHPHINDLSDNGSNGGGSGQIKATIKGDKIAVAVEGSKYFEVFSFNVNTGVLSRPMRLPAGNSENKDHFLHQAYGVEFSPTGNYLYGSTKDEAYIYQWDLNAFSLDVMIKSCKILFSNPEFEAGAMQLAPNGKIYVAFSGKDYLGVINNPLLSECGFVKYGARLVDNDTNLGGKSSLGLPAPVPGAISVEVFYFSDNCSNDTITFYIPDPTGMLGPRVWTIKNLTTGKTIVPTKPPSTSNECVIINPPAGEYEVKLTVMRNGSPTPYVRKFFIHDPPNPELAKVSPFQVCKSSIIELDAGNGAFYEWDDRSLEKRNRFVDVDTLPYLLNEVRVKVTGYNGCVGWDVIYLEPKAPPDIDTAYSTKATCGELNGSATVIPVGLITDFTYFWDYDSSGLNTLKDIGFGIYQVHVISKQSPFCETIVSISVSDFSAQSVKIESVDSTICPGEPVHLRIIGEVDEFEWINPSGISEKEVTITPLETTIIRLKIVSWDGDRRCELFVEDTIHVFPTHKPEIGADLSGCKGDTIWVEAPEQYAGWTWSNGFEGRVNPVTEEASPLVLFAEDENKCVFTDSLTVHFKPKPEVDLGRDRTECSRDPVTLYGGTGETYEWSTGDRSREISVNQNDTYFLKITTDGCFASDTVNLRINSPDRLKIDSVKVKDISCFGNGDGEIRIKAEGDGLSYLYSIDNGATFKDTSAFPNLLAGGNYRVTVWEDSACRVNYPDPVTILEPALIEAKSCINPPSCPECKDGNITLSNISGGTPPYKFWLDDTAADTDIQGLGPGNYTVTITDKNLCIWTTTVNMVAGTNVHIVSSTDEPVCPGTAVTLTVVNGSEVEWIYPSGTGPAAVVRPLQTTTYQASSTMREDDGFECTIVAEYTVQVIPHVKPDLGEDISACEGDTVLLTAGEGYLNWSWNTGANTRDIVLYSSMDPVIVFVTDPSNCILSDTIEVRYFKYPEVNLGEDKSLCTNLPITLSGGTGDSYLWSTGAEVQQISVSQTAIYRLEITRDGCSKSDEISVKILNPDLLQIDSPSVKDNTCFESGDGSIEIHARGEGAFYEYSIDDGSSWQTSPLFENLAADENFRIRVREDSLCTAEYPEPVAVTQPDKIEVNYRLKSPTCLGCSDGQIIIKEITGGVAPYTVSLAGVETSLTITGLAENTYSVVVMDSRLCSTSIDIKIDMNNVIPNVITPNGDGINDLWFIPLLEYYPEGEMRVLDSSGKGIRIYSFTNGYNSKPWDGKDEQGSAVPMGTYYYVLKYLDAEDGWMQLTGWVMVMR